MTIEASRLDRLDPDLVAELGGPAFHRYRPDPHPKWFAEEPYVGRAEITDPNLLKLLEHIHDLRARNAEILDGYAGLEESIDDRIDAAVTEAEAGDDW